MLHEWPNTETEGGLIPVLPSTGDSGGVVQTRHILTEANEVLLTEDGDSLTRE